MSIPVIFIHRGDSDFLEYTLTQARESNRSSDVILIGDDSNDKYSFVKHDKISNYYEGAGQFERLYSNKHMSINDYGFNLICFQRWYILRDFMRKNQIDQCFYQDSDNMLYVDVNEQQPLFGDYKLALCHYSGHAAFINGLKNLENFCGFTTTYYTDLSLFNKLKILYDNLIQQNTVADITDMTLFQLYLEQFQFRYHDLSVVFHDSIYDANIVLEQGCETQEGRKKIYVLDKTLYCRHLASSKFVKLNSLQFQGHNKKYIQYFMQSAINGLEGELVFDFDSSTWIKS